MGSSSDGKYGHMGMARRITPGVPRDDISREERRKELARMQKDADIASLARDIYVAMMGNSERYKYIAGLVDSGQISQDEATAKNISKAYRLATEFVNAQEKLDFINKG